MAKSKPIDKTKIIRIKVIKATMPRFHWYKSHIGAKYKAYEGTAHYHIPRKAGGIKSVLKQDAKII